MKSRIMAVDAGKGFTKYSQFSNSGEIESSIFPTRFTEFKSTQDNGDVGQGKEDFLIEYDGTKTLIGQGGKKDTRGESSSNKKHPIHRLAAYTAICNMLEKNSNKSDNITLVISAPALTYKNKVERESYAEFFKGPGDINMQVNGKRYDFTIRNVIVLPEALGFMFRYPKLCKDRTCIVDLGHFNQGFVELDNMSLVKMDTSEKGADELEKQVITELKTVVGLELERKVAQDTLKSGHLVQFGVEVPETRDVVKSIKKDYVNDIIVRSSTSQINLADMQNIYFLGGTSKALETEIMEHPQLSNTSRIIDNAAFVAVEGNLIFGERKINGSK